MATQEDAITASAEQRNSLSFRADISADKLKTEALLRGHLMSDALREIFKLGYPLYLKRNKPKFRPVEDEAAV